MTRVLLAEDEASIALTLGDALRDAGHEVLLAADTATAIAFLDGESPPDLVLTDVRMPGDGGLAVLDRSVELDADRPVILMTGFASVDHAVDDLSLIHI